MYIQRRNEVGSFAANGTLETFFSPPRLFLYQVKHFMVYHFFASDVSVFCRKYIM